MKRHQTTAWQVLAAVAVTVCFASVTLGQNEKRRVKSKAASRASQPDDQLANVLTERKEHLKRRLVRLRAIESNYGERHPSYQNVKTQIEDIEYELDNWKQRTEAIWSMSDRELRGLVLQMAVRIDLLEDRLGAAQNEL